MMGRTEVRDVRWDNDGGVAQVSVRVWSVKERDQHDRRFGITGEEFASAFAGAMTNPQTPGGQKGVQLARTLVDDQRRRFAEQGRESLTVKVATCLSAVDVPEETTPQEDGGVLTRSRRVTFPTVEGWTAWVESLDADVFDRLAVAVDEVLGLRPEAKKKSHDGPEA